VKYTPALVRPRFFSYMGARMATKLTAAELAGRLRVNVQTIWAWVRQGRLPCQRLGLRPILFDEQEVEEFLRRENGVTKMADN
jgi:excisionase family DNA binding protein